MAGQMVRGPCPCEGPKSGVTGPVPGVKGEDMETSRAVAILVAYGVGGILCPASDEFDRVTPKLQIWRGVRCVVLSKIEQISDIRPGAPNLFLMLGRPVGFTVLRPGLSGRC